MKKTVKPVGGKKSPKSTGKTQKKRAAVNNVLPVVGVGASAGGLEALEGLFGSISSEAALSIVLIQHLPPNYKSRMDSILSKWTSLPIRFIEDGMKLEAGFVYLNPPDQYVGILNSSFVLFDYERSKVPSLPIDFFFKSLADDQGKRSIGVVLSGTGSDGTLGLREIKERGGLTLVQDPAEAAYDSMPLSAIQSGWVDHVLPVKKMWKVMDSFAEHPYMKPMASVDLLPEKSKTTISKILHHLRDRVGHDFTEYKETTINRRVTRRLAVHRIKTYEEYLLFLSDHPEEAEALYRDLLIGVTGFFRDAEAFKVLKEKAIDPLLEQKTSDDPLRIWVPGCATGEEAYSIAILAAEKMEKAAKYPEVKIFASDIDPESLQKARTGVYYSGIESDVSKIRLEKFFVRKGDQYIVSKRIRDMVLFAQQNFVKDPPFSRLDLISCRNVLIYMNPELQKSIQARFHYALNSGGYLFLGSAESVGAAKNYYTVVDAKWNLFQSRELGENELKMVFDYLPRTYFGDGEQGEKHLKRVEELDARRLVEREILKSHTPTGVLVNSRFECLYFVGSTESYLRLPAGEFSFDVLKMIHSDLRFHLTQLLQKVIIDGQKLTSENIPFEKAGRDFSLTITVEKLQEKQGKLDLMLIFFEESRPAPEEVGEVARKKEGDRTSGHPKVEELENELSLTRRYLQDTIEELETANEELRSTNEELQSTNEELQSSMEETETSREELQSTNEELQTINAELQEKVQELTISNDDLNNLLASTHIATIFLGRDLTLRRFTPAVTELFNLRKLDLGRPISDITSTLEYKDMAGDIMDVLDTLVIRETEVRSESGEWFDVRILPYRTMDNIIDGVVMTFINITKSKRYDKSRETLERFTGLFHNSLVGLVQCDASTGKVIEANDRAVQILGFKDREDLLAGFNFNSSVSVSDHSGSFMNTLEHQGSIENMMGGFLKKDGTTVELGFSARLDLKNHTVDTVLTSFTKGGAF